LYHFVRAVTAREPAAGDASWRANCSRTSYPRPSLEKARARLQALLAESPQWTGGKQRLNAARLRRMLVTEGFTIGVTTVRGARLGMHRGGVPV
jgi:hypothetical protein